MALKKIAVILCALLALLASPLAYASNVEVDSGTSPVDTQCIILPNYFWYCNMPGLYTWADNSKSDDITETGNFLRLNRSPIYHLDMTIIPIDRVFFSGEAIYGTYTRNLSDSIDKARFTTEYEGTWYMVSADTLHLRLKSGDCWNDPSHLFPWLPAREVFNGNLHVDTQWQGLQRQYTISLFGHDLVKTIPWHHLPIIANTGAGTESNGA